jgi:alpha-glucosidase
MKRRCCAVLALAAACQAPPPPSATVGAWTLVWEDGELRAEHAEAAPLRALRLLAGTGDAVVEGQFGSFRVVSRVDAVRVGIPVGLEGGQGDAAVRFADERGAVGSLLLSAGPAGTVTGRLVADEDAVAGGAPRLGLSAACDDTAFLGLGLHALDVDHRGQAFDLWVSEPGLGKVETDEPPTDWFSTGTRHSSSFPVPWVLRPEAAHGVALDAGGRVEVDLCASDVERFSLLAWDEAEIGVTLVGADTALGALQRLSDVQGRPPLPPAWAFTPWTTGIRGPESVSARARAIRGAGAATSVIWTEDWRGAQSSDLVGYHPGPDWDLDPSLYPDAPAFADALADDGFAWFAYFAPFLTPDTDAWEAALAADLLIRGVDGGIATFLGPFFEPTSLVDLSTEEGRAFVGSYLDNALDNGFRGWMTDFAEWLPIDAVLASGETGATAHNRYPRWWAEAHAERSPEAVWFARAGWAGSQALAPIVWGGDQRTSFQPDDGLPTVLALGMGAGASGVGVFTHDVAGYQSATNPPADAELWNRWAWLGAFTPILRTHHGNESLLNHQLDTDAETLARWVDVTAAHMALFPYRYGLAARYARDGTPMVLPPALWFPDDDPGRTDAWMLGPSLLVAPVVEGGVSAREVSLPPGARWFDWWTGAEVDSGTFPAPLDTIPVFVAEGSLIPLLVDIPDTGLPGAVGLRTLADVDGAREVRVYGAGGGFVEADGTTYTTSGTPSAPGEATWVGAEGEVTVAGLTVRIVGATSRTYTVRVVP